jgi:outer membrane receptor for ferrienterochelin and colicins
MRPRPPVTFLLVALFALLAQPLVAQIGTVSGAVRSAETGAPLISALVELNDASGGSVAATLTNQTGNFRIADVPAGSYELVAATTGYETGRQAVNLTAGQSVTITFDLATQAISLNPIVISASRREERALDAPAHVEVVSPVQIEERPAVQPTDHLRSVAGVDIISQGLQASNVVARGFNNIFSGALLALTDHRIAAVPSLRLNALQLIPATNEDIERIEVVLGPGSALYGPNTANGVMHIFTRSPLTYQGTSISLTGGERSVFQASGRTAQMVGENLGVKVSGMYFRGDEWEHTDQAEVIARQNALPGDPNTRIGLRNFEAERYSVDGRIDWRITPGATGILSAGRAANLKGIELTGLGASQVRDFTYNYVQARFNTGGLFAQAYTTFSSAGDTYLLRTGLPTTDESRFYVGQVQHAVSPTNWQDFTYGVDYLRTDPDTKGTIHGRFEDEDTYTEIGAFLQSETTLADRLDVVLAGRIDRHSVVDELVFSPRAALVFRPAELHTIRASYNRAYSNPGSVQLFLDLPSGPAPGEIGQLGYTIRAQGTGRDGISFETDEGEFVMRSPFAADPLQMQDITVPALWAYQVQGLAGSLQARGDFNQAQAAAFVQFMTPQIPVTEVYGINPVTQVSSEFTGVADVPGIRESNTTSYEIGYNGILGGRLLLAADVWYAQRDNFISSAIPQSPLLHLNPADVVPWAQPRIQAFLTAGGVPNAAELSAEMAQGLAAIPGGVVAAPGVPAIGPDLVVSYRNYGDIDLWGSDLAATALFGPWSVGVTGSWVSEDYFETQGQIVTLNAPTVKGSATLGYRNEDAGFNAEARVRHMGEFPVVSGAFVGITCIDPEATNSEECVESNTLADLTLGYDIGAVPGAALQLSVQNVFDTDYRSFVGVPDMGRLALLRLRYEF